MSTNEDLNAGVVDGRAERKAAAERAAAKRAAMKRAAVANEDREALALLIDPNALELDSHSWPLDAADRILAAGFHRTMRSDGVQQVLAWIDKTLTLPVYQEPFSDIAETVVVTLKTVRKMLDGTSRPDASWRTVPTDTRTEGDEA